MQSDNLEGDRPINRNINRLWHHHEQTGTGTKGLPILHRRPTHRIYTNIVWALCL